MIKLTLQNGRVFKNFKESKIELKNGNKKYFRDINIGDEIKYDLNQYNKKSHTKLKNISTLEFKQGKNGVKEYNLPTKMNENLAWLIGAYMANGSYPVDKDRKNQSRIKFHCEHKKIHKKVQRIWKEQFGAETTIIKSSDRNSYTQDFSSVKIRKWLKYNKLNKKYNVKYSIIPIKIKKSSKKDILSFITGYADNDGCFHSKSFCIDSSDPNFIRYLQEVGELVGLSFSFIVNSERDGYSNTPIYKNHLSRVYSIKNSIDYINKVSIKAQERPIINSDGYRYIKYPYKVIYKERI